MTSNPDEIRRDIERTRASLSYHVDELTEQTWPSRIAERQVSKVKAAGSRLLESVMGTAEDAKAATADSLQQLGDSVSDQAQQVGDTLSRAPEAVRRQTVGNPIAAGLVAFGVGLLLAAAFPASQRERELAETVKEKAEPLTDQVVSAAKEVAANLSEPASEAIESLKETATDAAEHVRAEGQDAVADVRQHAGESAGEVADTARTAAGDATSTAQPDEGGRL